MRSNLSLSIGAWALAGIAALSLASFAACAKAVTGDLDDVPDGGYPGSGNGEDSGAQTGNGAVDAGPTIGSLVDANGPSSGDDGGGSNNGDDGGTGTGDDGGGSVIPDSGQSGGEDSAAPPLDVCPDTSTYQNEYLDLNLFTLTDCETNSDCSTKDCCYAGSQVVSLVGPACVKK